MDFQKYIDNLHNQLKAVNADILEKEEELTKLKDFRTRIKGGLEVVNQIKSDTQQPETTLQEELRQEIKELQRHGGDMDAMWQCTNRHIASRQGPGVRYNMNIHKGITPWSTQHWLQRK